MGASAFSIEPSVAKKPHIALNGRAFSHDRVFLARVCVPTWAVGREDKVGGNMETMMTFRAVGLRSLWLKCFTLLWVAGVCSSATSALAADEPDLIFRRSTVFKLLSPNDKLATYGVDDPEVDGVACHFTVPEKGGYAGWLGLSEQVSDISLACRQIGPIKFKHKLEQADDMFRQRRSLFFKKMQIVRGCDAKRNVLVYMVYSDKLIEGSPKNSTSSVPIMPWGAADAAVQKCGEFIQ
jgi:CreA protein